MRKTVRHFSFYFFYRKKCSAPNGYPYSKKPGTERVNLLSSIKFQKAIFLRIGENSNTKGKPFKNQAFTYPRSKYISGATPSSVLHLKQKRKLTKISKGDFSSYR